MSVNIDSKELPSNYTLIPFTKYISDVIHILSKYLITDISSIISQYIKYWLLPEELMKDIITVFKASLNSSVSFNDKKLFSFADEMNYFHLPTFNYPILNSLFYHSFRYYKKLLSEDRD